MQNKLLDTLSYIGEKLNASNIKWGVGASILLHQFGLIDKPNDIDIFIDIQDIEQADEILKGIGKKKVYKETSVYSTKFFYEYKINTIDVDVMSGFAVNHDSGVFKYIFDHHSISVLKEINGVAIPFTSLEDWYVIYQLIPDREAKVKLIENYLLLNGIENPFLLERILEENLPNKVKNRVKNILNS